MKFSHQIASAIFVLSSVSPAFAIESSDAIELKGRYGIGVGAGAALPFQSPTFRDANSTGWAFDGRGLYNFTNALGIELNFSRLQYEGGNPKRNLFGAGLNYRVMSTSRMTPVLGFGAGYATIHGDQSGSFDNWFVNGKIGLDYAMTDCFLVGVSGRYNLVIADQSGFPNEHTIIPQLNLTFYFGESDHSEPMVAPVAKPVAKADGDDDSDGVRNSIDQCSGTPSGQSVNSLGCLLDQKVDMTIAVQFAPSRAVVDAKFHSELEKISKLLADHSDLKMEIQGYSDSRGVASKNVTLSEARAAAVANYLVKQLGADSTRITSKGYGPANPIADNATADGRTQNRRVIASIQSR